MANNSSRFDRFGRACLALGAVSLMAVAGSTSAAQAHSAAKSKYGGTYTYRNVDNPDCLDPQKTAAAASIAVAGYVVDSLLSVDSRGHYVGNLATGYSVAKGGTQLTFRLRHGVRFSNGDQFNANAVKYSFNRALNPATKSPVTASMLASIADTQVINKYTVRLDLKTANRPLLTNLASTYTGILDPKATSKQGAKSCSDPIGTGPYKIQSSGPAFSTVTVVTNKYRNFAPPWVHNKGKPYVSKVVFESIPSDDTAISDLLTGALDFTNIPGPQLSRVKGNKKIVRHTLPAANLIWMSFNSSHKPFNNVQVRRAVAGVINRKGIVKAALNGLGGPVYGPLSPALPFYDKSAKSSMPAFNINAAAKIINKYHAHGPYTLLVPSVPPFTTIAEIMQANLAQAGMKVNLVSKSLGDWIATANAGNFDINLLNYQYSDADVLYFLLHSSQEHGGLNWTRYHDATLDKLLVEGRTTLNSKKVAKVYAAIQTRVNKEAIFLGIADETTLLGTRSRLKGLHFDSTGAWAIQDIYIG
jgi:peptide/nickel transport system substrate-binding protein